MLVISVFPRETLFTYIRSRLCDDVEVQPREKKQKGSKEREREKKRKKTGCRATPSSRLTDDSRKGRGDSRPADATISAHTAFRNFRCAKLAVLETLKNPGSSNRLRT